MTNAVESSIKGLKCDAPECDYSDMSITVDSYEEYIDAPCPDCGANLLTQADFDMVQTIIGITDSINTVFEDIELPEGELETFTISMDGSGIPHIKDAK